MLCPSPISKLDKHLGRINVPCGTCIWCKARRRNDWSYRLWIEYRKSNSAYFITMTYDQSKLVDYLDEKTGELLPSLHKPHVQNFIKRVRKSQETFLAKHNTENRQIRYYLCGEYGEKTKRPHYHMIIFNLETEIKEKIPTLWGLGHVHIGTCNAKTIAYTTKYVMKDLKTQPSFVQPPFSLMSKNPALGKSYINLNSTYHKKNLSSQVRNADGKFQAMPRYLKEKIFTKQERLIIADKTIPKMDQKALEEELRITALGDKVGKYQREQQQNQERKHKNNLNREKL